MYKYFFFFFVPFCVFLYSYQARALKKQTYFYKDNKITYTVSASEQLTVAELIKIQNFYLNKDAHNCLKAINSWSAPKNIEIWLYVKKLKCIRLAKKNKVKLYKKNISYPPQWMLARATYKELNAELKFAIFFLLKHFLKNHKESQAASVLKKIDTLKFFKSQKDKSYLFYIKARIFYALKQFNLSKQFLKNSFFYHKQSGAEKYPFALSYLTLVKTFKNKELVKGKKYSSYFPQELKTFNKISKLSKRRKIFFEQHIKYLTNYHSSKRSKIVNIRLLKAYLALKDSKKSSFKVLSKLSNLECVFLEKMVGKFFYKAKYPDMISIYKSTNCHWTGDNYFRIATAYYYIQNYKAAERMFKNLPQRYSGHAIIARSLLFLSFTYIKQNQYKQAIVALKNILKISKTDLHLQAYYFLHSLYKAQNNILKSNLYYKKLTQRYPLTYYSLKTKSANSPLSKLFVHRKNKEKKYLIYLSPNESLSWDKLKLFLKAGWTREAKMELKTWTLPIFSSGIFLYTYLLSQAHDFLPAIKVLHYLWKEDKSFYRKAVLQLLFPHFFNKLVKKYANQNQIDPNLVFSLIRQESAFKVDAQSSANAYGLMQIIISTANEVKKLLGFSSRSLSKFELFQPKTNIQLGTRHLRQLITAWQGNIPLALASYNAGYGNISKWIKARGPSFKITQDTDFLNQMWFDELPWTETSFYIKAILRNQILYQSLYKKTNTL